MTLAEHFVVVEAHTAKHTCKWKCRLPIIYVEGGARVIDKGWEFAGSQSTRLRFIGVYWHVVVAVNLIGKVTKFVHLFIYSHIFYTIFFIRLRV